MPGQVQSMSTQSLALRACKRWQRFVAAVRSTSFANAAISVGRPFGGETENAPPSFGSAFIKCRFARSSQVRKRENEPENNVAYLMASYTLNIGMYIAMTMKPTMAPTSTIMIGSRIEVSALTAAATSSS
jgi:hypothetical protein